MKYVITLMLLLSYITATDIDSSYSLKWNNEPWGAGGLFPAGPPWSMVGPYDLSATAIDMLMAPSLLSSTFYEEGFAATYTFFGTEEGVTFRRPEADFLLFLINPEIP